MRPQRKKTPLRDLTTYGLSRAVRHPDCSYTADELIHATICADAGAPFTAPQLNRLVCDSVDFYCKQLRYRLFGYCLMPDHLHALLSPQNSGNPFALWLYKFKDYTGRMYGNGGGKPPLWQRSAHDHVCRDGETAENVIAYIVNNPVAAGLVERWPDWPWTKVLIEL